MSRTIRTPGEAKTAPETTDLPDTPSAPAIVAPEPAAAPIGDLPNAIDIDAKTIRGPVLTRQGWVCPDETGKRAPDSLKA